MRINRVRSYAAYFVIIISSIFLVLLQTDIGHAQDQGTAAKTESTALSRADEILNQEKIIGTHSKMLECLKANKPTEECRQQMMQECAAMGACEGCSMHNGMMGKGAMHRGNMAPAPVKPGQGQKK